MARLVWRYRRLPRGLQRYRHLPLLASLLRDPEEGPWVLPLFVHLLQLQVGATPVEPGRFWQDSGRVAIRGGVSVDLVSGLPLRLRRPRDGAEMALIPACTVRVGDSGSRDVEDVYVDVVRRDGAAFDRYREATGGEAPGQLHNGQTNGFQPAETVLGFCRWVSARPVRLEEMAAYGAGVRFFPPPQPDHDDDLRAAAKARHRARQAAAAASTPYGIQDLRGGDWCLSPVAGERGGYELISVHRGNTGPPEPWEFGERYPLRLAVPALHYPDGWQDHPGDDEDLAWVFPHGLPDPPG